ncbi:uncharacterized protein A4U43_C03F17460 [Asparagus officinalis]|uniref:Pentatricopeptide repeat-containing protein n=1 Tax=Asparagus officinalis TaxID=4686 RepID=A0A5P1FFT8_ASPOF|nr:uncharacterized protein A4U43_C03F17460 [Asparagus officinalis]
MLRSQILPQTDSCYRLLSSFVKLKQLDKAWIVYAEMFRARIRSTVHTFNIMINVLCKQGLVTVKCEASPVARFASQELSSNITPCPPPPVVVGGGGACGGLVTNFIICGSTPDSSMKRVKDLAFSELTLLAENVDHDVEGVEGGSDPGAEHLGVDDPGLVELLELDEGGEQAVAGVGLGEDLGSEHEAEEG